MIRWYYGNTNAGKTTKALAEAKLSGALHIDGDILREITGNHDLSEAGRRRQNWTAAKLAQELAFQGFDVVVSTICPYRDQREQIKKTLACEFVYLGYEGDDQIEESPFER